KRKPKKSTETRKIMQIIVESNAFNDGETLPIDYTCDGKDISPPLSWKNLPKETQSVALLCDDPDAPMGTWIHWILFNISPSITTLTEAVDEATISGAIRGNNSWNRTGFGGACPPTGEHRYIFRIYALDTKLSLTEGATKTEILNNIKGHVLGMGNLTGRYSRKKRN
ncbi:YbhB/YbcL family Raf kinase inhibitor-like protein, partial [Candidatus Babeliales bacterium]|nr:YbhB/YbcL family Raf kinase inhibitor-like protein [Candidatus Babeliales bacterium]